MPKGNKYSSSSKKLDVHKGPRKEWEEFSREERLTNEVASVEPNLDESSSESIQNNRLETGGF